MIRVDTEVFKHIKGKSEDSLEFKNYMDSVDEDPLIEDFDGGRRYYSFPKTGMNFIFDDSRLIEAQLFTDGVEEDTACYKGQLPYGLDFLYSFDEVNQKLGAPNIFKDGIQDHKLLGQVYPWCKYLFKDYSLRIEFEMDKTKIRMVSLA